MSLIFSRDEQGKSTGTVFSDDGMTVHNFTDKPENRNYEHYKLTFSDNSTIRSEATGNMTRRNTSVSHIFIADAVGLEGIDYACWSNKTDNKKVELRATYNKYINALWIEPKNGTAMIPLYDMGSISMGAKNSSKPNLCQFGNKAPLKVGKKNKVNRFLGKEPTQ